VQYVESRKRNQSQPCRTAALKAQDYQNDLIVKGYDAVKNEDYSQAFKLFDQSSKLAQPEGVYGLAMLYTKGFGVEEDKLKGFDLLSESAQQGYYQAQAKLGWHYLKGIIVEKDFKKAVHWYTKAARQGNSRIQWRLGFTLATAEKVKHRDYSKAMHWLKESANQGYAEAQYQIGQLYKEGNGVVQSNKKAYIWTSISVANGAGYYKFMRDYLATTLSKETLQEAQEEASELNDRLEKK